MEERRIKPIYTAYYKTSNVAEARKAISYLKELGYLPCYIYEDKFINGDVVVYTETDASGNGVVNLITEKSFNTKIKFPEINTFGNYAYFYHVCAINRENDLQQYFVVDEEYLFNPYEIVPKGSFGLSFVDDYSLYNTHKYHKANAKELYEYFIGSARDVVVKALPSDLFRIIKCCDGYGNKQCTVAPSLEWVHAWLRIKHKLYIYVVPRFDGFDGAQYDCHYEIYREGSKKSIDISGDGTYSYDEAMLTAIRECLVHHIEHTKLIDDMLVDDTTTNKN